MSIYQLPKDILIYISEYCDVVTLVRFSLAYSEVFRKCKEILKVDKIKYLIAKFQGSWFESYPSELYRTNIRYDQEKDLFNVEIGKIKKCYSQNSRCKLDIFDTCRKTLKTREIYILFQENEYNSMFVHEGEIYGFKIGDYPYIENRNMLHYTGEELRSIANRLGIPNEPIYVSEIVEKIRKNGKILEIKDIGFRCRINE